MFTGIIENQGIVIKRQERGGQVRFGFRFVRKEKGLKIGDSIAVSGTCLTAVQVNPSGFEADVVRETLQATTLGDLKIGDTVNLEKSLKLGDSLGGHFVTGHVDGRGTVVKIERRKKNTTLFIRAPEAIIALQAPKGSIALDGISLTVQKVHKDVFEIAVIPHTLKVTTLGFKRPGSEVNVEVDIVARYLRACFSKKKTGAFSSRSILKALLKEGF
ncbi:MAG TPA: riboflavin synthase [Candidatus Omnitrophota bacterium]|jgi:riboflavin synthase|nr:MAG: Riboflavin synthase [Candidatus Omnitrophica bacterium ADurb.Bin314]HOE68718.1 riboflavin synthase [Candidatus Omnitrophota bacterium]HQB94885.1 riboflavin synthase [Candidatus Omnitrophota bacterium]